MLNERIEELRTEIEAKNEILNEKRDEILIEIRNLRNVELQQIADEKGRILAKMAPYAEKMSRKHEVQFNENDLAPFIANVRAHLSLLQQRKMRPLLQAYGELLQTEASIDGKYENMLNDELASMQTEIDRLDAYLMQLNRIKSLLDNPAQFLNDNLLNMVSRYAGEQIDKQTLANNLNKANDLFNAIQVDDFNPDIVTALDKFITELSGRKAMNDYNIEGNDDDIRMMEATKQTANPNYKITQDDNARRHRENEAIESIVKNLAVQLEHQKQLAAAVGDRPVAMSSTQSSSLSDVAEKSSQKKHKHHHSHKNKDADKGKKKEKVKHKRKHHHEKHDRTHVHADKRKASRSPSPSVQPEPKRSRSFQVQAQDENLSPNANAVSASPAEDRHPPKAATLVHQYQASKQSGDGRVRTLVQMHQDAINKIAEDAEKSKFKKK